MMSVLAVAARTGIDVVLVATAGAFSAPPLLLLEETCVLDP